MPFFLLDLGEFLNNSFRKFKFPTQRQLQKTYQLNLAVDRQNQIDPPKADKLLKCFGWIRFANNFLNP